MLDGADSALVDATTQDGTDPGDVARRQA